MKDLAPDIFRQRLLIEGFFSVNVEEQTIKDFFENLTIDKIRQRRTQ